LTAVIRAEGLTRSFRTSQRDLVAVDRLDIEVGAGEVLGFLGPNGAGKTTTVRLLCGLIAPTAGRAWIDGQEVGTDNLELRRRVGLLTETPGLYERLSVARNLMLFAKLYGVRDVDAPVERYLRQFDLWDRRDDPAGSLSKGMRQKIAIARALLHEPKVLFLDEPTSGLDPEASKLVREAIATLKGEGRTIWLCTHNLDESDRLCDRVAVFRSRLLAVDTPANLRRQLFGRQVVFHLRDAQAAHAEVIRPLVRQVSIVDGKLVASVDDPEATNPQLVRALVAAGADVRFVTELKHTLEEVYSAVMESA
jgi:ABC-2 type transport system ATP-binding protein